MKAIGRTRCGIGGNEYSNSSLLRFFVRFSVRFFHFLHGFGAALANSANHNRRISGPSA